MCLNDENDDLTLLLTENLMSKIISVTDMQTVTAKVQLAWSECTQYYDNQFLKLYYVERNSYNICI